MAHRRLLICLVIVGGLLWVAGPVGRFVVVVPIILFVPGYLFERKLLLANDLPFLVKPAIWLASSLSLIPLLYAWSWLVGLPLVTPLLAGGLVACLAATAWLVWRSSGRYTVTRITIACVCVLVATLVLRFYEIRNESLPLWVDSVHHALLIRIVGETGALPLSLRPYLPVDTLPYHWGYHVVMSVVVQLSGMPLPEAMLWMGQILNALEALVVAALAAAMWRSNIAGLAAAVVVGLMSLMPAYLVTWGRYTLLDGLLLLPPLLIVALLMLRRPTRAAWAHVALFTAGLLFTHYIVSVFAIVLLPLLCLWYIVLAPHRSLAAARAMNDGVSRLRFSLQRYLRVMQLGGAGVAGACLAAPWIWILAQQVVARYVNQPAGFVGGADYNAFSPGLLWAGQNRLLFALAVVALVLTLWRRQTIGIFLAIWPLLLLLLANPVVIGLPYIWLVTNTEVLVSLYIPVAVLVGGGAQVLWTMHGSNMYRDVQANQHDQQSYTPVRQSYWRAVLLVALLLGSVTSAARLGDVINPDTRIATKGDLEAMTWIAHNTPANARFLTSAAAWLSTAERGGDGGWWLVPLTGRWSSTPPVLFTYAAPSDVQAIRARTRLVASTSAERDAQIETMIEDSQIDYVYIGSLPTSLKAAPFDANPAYHRVYAHDGVIIFERR